MNDLLQLIASCFLNSFWEVAAVGGAGWIVSRLLKHLGPRFHHLLWVTTLGLAAITPTLPLLRFMLAQIAFRTTAQNHSLVTSVFDQQPVSNGPVLTPAAILTVFCLFLCAFLWSAAQLGWSLHYTIRLRRGACPVSLGPEVRELWGRCKKAFSVGEAEVLHSEMIAGPVTIAFARPAVLIPRGFIEQCAPRDILVVLAHECAHIKRRDFQKNLLYEMASLAIAYHPLTWFVKSQIARTREMTCDEMATQKLIDPSLYAESLIRLAKRISLTAGSLSSNALGILDANVLEERIMTIKTEKSDFGWSLKCGLTTGSVVLLFCVAAGSGAIARPIKAQSQVAPANSASAKGHSRVDLSCTYYDARDQGFDGTCETHKGDKAHYYCAANYDRKLSQEQIGCESKIERAKSQKVKVQGPQK
ncbi:MAG TPA: M56 family metallopeptidase [Candidatus Cybelea sp.]|nr:M56 family metallopeptidase [Candidatus Cybelea sp.]